MPEETSSTQPVPEIKKPAALKKKGGWFQKIPKDILFSPGGVILIFFALMMEVIDFVIPYPLIEEIIMLPLNLIFCLLLVLIAKVSIKSLIIPLFIERIPIISSILPTWLIRMFI
ncbi:MAG: hypothetical protein FJZ07_02140 [Candidatus Nealsonbacteria bacterium]|nr:hypothetical protein [Candidatus Nealsonbacteria bacterium]